MMPSVIMILEDGENMESMEEKGFTLAELLGVIVLLSVIAMISLPPIINQIKKAKDNISDATLTIISNSAKLYVDDRPNTYQLKNGDTYCITLQTLVDNAYLKAPIEDVQTGNEIELNRTVKYQVEENQKTTISLVKPINCREYIQ